MDLSGEDGSTSWRRGDYKSKGVVSLTVAARQNQKLDPANESLSVPTRFGNSSNMARRGHEPTGIATIPMAERGGRASSMMGWNTAMRQNNSPP